MSKLVFFDIDNTLMGIGGRVPESAVRAVHGLQRNGHKAILCSGRTRGFIREEELLAIGFDGIISGCGTEIEYEGRVLFRRLIEGAEAVRVVESVKRHAFPTILEGPRYLYFDKEEFAGDGYAQYVEGVMGKDLLSMQDNWGEWEFGKFSCIVNHATKDALICDLGSEYDFLFHNENIVEIVPKGFDKSSGMAWLCAHLGTEQQDTMAFGDGTNDIGMLQWAGIGVAMGNANDEAKEAADHVTDDLWDDGVAKALRHFGLI